MYKHKIKDLATTAAVGAAMLSPAAFAGGGSGSVDVSSVVSAIEGAAVPIAAIGAATLIVLVGIKVYKWIRRAM